MGLVCRAGANANVAVGPILGYVNSLFADLEVPHAASEVGERAGAPDPGTIGMTSNEYRGLGVGGRPTAHARVTEVLVNSH